MARSRDSNRQRKIEEGRLSGLASQHAKGELSAGDFAAAALVSAHPWEGLNPTAVATMRGMECGAKVVGLAMGGWSLVDVRRSGILDEDPRIVAKPPYQSFKLRLQFAGRKGPETTRPDGFVVGERAIGDLVANAVNERQEDGMGRLGSRYLELAAVLAMLDIDSQDATSLKTDAIDELVAGTKSGELRQDCFGEVYLMNHMPLQLALELLHLLEPEEAERLVDRLRSGREDDPDCIASIEKYLSARAELRGA